MIMIDQITKNMLVAVAEMKVKVSFKKKFKSGANAIKIVENIYAFLGNCRRSSFPKCLLNLVLPL